MIKNKKTSTLKTDLLDNRKQKKSDKIQYSVLSIKFSIEYLKAILMQKKINLEYILP